MLNQFEIDSRSILMPFLVSLCLGGIALGLTSDFWFPQRWQAVVEMAMLLCACAVITWIMQLRWLHASLWFLVFTFAGSIVYGGARLEASALLALLALPNLLAVTLISFRAGLLLTAAESLPLLILHAQRGDPNISVALLLVWAVLPVMHAITGSMHQTAQWAWDYYQKGLSIHQESFEQQGQLNQALQDLTRANLQLTRLHRLAQMLRQSAEDARAAKEQFVANVSHELRTPLNMITGFIETMLQAPETYGRKIPPALLADLTVVYRNAEHLSSLIDDILDLSQVEMGAMTIVREPVNFQEILADATSAVSPLFESRRLALQTELPPDLPPVFCDRTRMREVVLNLLSNAGRFTERGGVRVRVWREAGHLLVSVTDTGPGIKPEAMQKLFQPFYQVDGSLRRRFGGSGLGLSISKRFIELHEGRIWVESQEGVGSTFSFSIPLNAHAPLESSALNEMVPRWEFMQHPRPHQGAGLPRPDLPRYVVVETGQTLQRFLRRSLEGVEVTPMPGLAQALAALEREPARALLVNDPRLPEICSAVAAPASLPEGVPVCICSVAGFDEEAESLGASRRLVKPIQREALSRAMLDLGIHTGTILIVDDDPDTLQLLARMLASYNQGYRALSARSGREALEILKDVTPDLILLDLFMPTLDGYRFLEQRSQSPAHRAIPVIILSAHDPSQHPVTTPSLVITQKNGFSIHQILKTIRFVSEELFPVS